MTDNSQRLEKLQAQIRAHQLDGIALVPGPNMVYFTHIHAHLSERPIVLIILADEAPAIIIPNLEAMKASKAGIPKERIFGWGDEEGYHGAFQRASEQLGLAGKQLGVESLHMRVLEADLLRQHADNNLQLTHADAVMAEVRLIKEVGEVAAMEKAIAVAEKAMEELLPQIKVGMTEKTIAGMLTEALLQGGADSIAFGPIVSAGPNSASPHATPTERPLQNGDLLVIDWGVYVDGYPSDITRTFAVGEIAPELRRIYETVKLANEQGKLAAAPAKTGQDVDRAAREVIDDAGYGDYFIHRTGHGLGLEVHEPPYMMEGYTKPLATGHVFTVEPGIYIPNKGGVRIEDDVIITEDGHRVLTSFPRELITVG